MRSLPDSEDMIRAQYVTERTYEQGPLFFGSCGTQCVPVALHLMQMPSFATHLQRIYSGSARGRLATDHLEGLL